jgi:hypothetical protein
VWFTADIKTFMRYRCRDQRFFCCGWIKCKLSFSYHLKIIWDILSPICFSLPLLSCVHCCCCCCCCCSVYRYWVLGRVMRRPLESRILCLTASRNSCPYVRNGCDFFYPVLKQRTKYLQMLAQVFLMISTSRCSPLTIGLNCWSWNTSKTFNEVHMCRYMYFYVSDILCWRGCLWMDKFETESQKHK